MLPTVRDKLLFTPGPLTTSLSVKQAMLRDAGSWHSDFNAVVAGIRERLLAVAGVSREGAGRRSRSRGAGRSGSRRSSRPPCRRRARWPCSPTGPMANGWGRCSTTPGSITS